MMMIYSVPKDCNRLEKGQFRRKIRIKVIKVKEIMAVPYFKKENRKIIKGRPNLYILTKIKILLRNSRLLLKRKHLKVKLYGNRLRKHEFCDYFYLLIISLYIL